MGNVISNIPGEQGSYRRFYVNQGAQQVGFIVRTLAPGNNGGRITTPDSIAGQRGGFSSGSSVSANVAVNTWVRFIKTSSNNPGGTFDFRVSRYTAVKEARNNSGNFADWSFSSPKEWFSRLNVTFTALTGTCNISTSPSTVQLGSVYLHQIPNPGNAAAAVPFTVQFNNCPVGYSSIKYRFEAFPNPGNFEANGVLPAMSPSLATGVGVQVLQNNGTTPIVFSSGNFNYTLAAYTSSPGQTTYNVPLRARLIRRAANATAGSVFAQMQVVAQYN